jgi:hypothetical protein
LRRAASKSGKGYLLNVMPPPDKWRPTDSVVKATEPFVIVGVMAGG